MIDSRPTLAEIFRTYGDVYQSTHPTSPQQRKVLRDLAICRTSALGGYLHQCDRCGHQHISYKSCRNRHCPQCLGHRRQQWLEARQRDLLPVPYFHLVFTLPEPLRPIFFANQRLLYSQLFASVSRTLQTLARDPLHLGADIGLLAILHTWAQNLLFHPHIHCLVPAGGLSLQDQRWVSSRPGFLLPVRVLSAFFKNHFLRRLRRAFRHRQLHLPGPLSALSHPHHCQALCQQLQSIDWNVYCKPPFGGPQHVLRYLAAYTHRVALSNQRILSIDDQQIRLRCRPRHSNSSPTLTLHPLEFIRRFLLHVLPSGFVRIRYFGLLANCCRKKKIARCLQFLPPSPHPDSTANPLLKPLSADPQRRCPSCRLGLLILIADLPPGSTPIPSMNSP